MKEKNENERQKEKEDRIEEKEEEEENSADTHNRCSLNWFQLPSPIQSSFVHMIFVIFTLNKSTAAHLIAPDRQSQTCTSATK